MINVKRYIAVERIDLHPFVPHSLCDDVEFVSEGERRETTLIPTTETNY